MRRLAALAFALTLSLAGCNTVPGTYTEEWVIMRLNGLDHAYKLVIEPGRIVDEVPKNWVKGKNGYWQPPNGWPPTPETPPEATNIW